MALKLSEEIDVTVDGKKKRRGQSDREPVPPTLEQFSKVLEYFLSEYPVDGRLGVMKLGNKISSSWQDLIRSQLTGKVEPPVNRCEESKRDMNIALELSKSPFTKSERVEEWKKRTGKSRDTYYRLLRELQ